MGDLIAEFIVWCITTWAGRAVAVVLIALFALIGWHFEYGTEKTVTFTVTQLDDQGTYRSHQYMIDTVRSDGQTEVFKDTDAFWHGKHDSSDVWARFGQYGKGATWRCPVYGFRLYFGSHYRDILDGCVLVPKVKPSLASPASFYPTPTGKPPVSMVLTGTAR